MKIYLTALCLVSVAVLIQATENTDEDQSELSVFRVPRGAHSKKKDAVCRYKKGPWTECDSSNMQKKTLSLKKGDSSSCEQTKEIVRKCKKACKYSKGVWSDCEVSSTNMRVRTDTLKPKSDPSCDPTRTISKKCKKSARQSQVCKYQKAGIWSECNVATGIKTKSLPLKSGSPHTCEPEKKISKPCNKGGHKASKGKKDDYDEEED